MLLLPPNGLLQKNGAAFEAVVRAREARNRRFAFMQHAHPHHSHYRCGQAANAAECRRGGCLLPFAAGRLAAVAALFAFPAF
jgi:hypothetical protein